MSDTNYAVAPGEYLAEWMDEHWRGVRYLADLMVIEVGRLNRILSGEEPITTHLAEQLHFATGIPQRTWEGYEAKYRADLACLAERGSGV